MEAGGGFEEVGGGIEQRDQTAVGSHSADGVVERDLERGLRIKRGVQGLATLVEEAETVVFGFKGVELALRVAHSGLLRDRAEGERLKSEIRNPKSEGNPKVEVRNPKP